MDIYYLYNLSLIAVVADEKQKTIWGLSLLFGILLVLVIAIVVFVKLKRRLFDQDQDGAKAFSLGELKEMRQIGKISQQEYETLRDQIINTYK